jgi:acetyltransferase
VLELAPDREAVRHILESVRAAGRLRLLEDEALAVLAAYGLPTVPGMVAMTPAQAAEDAERLAFPWC